MANTYKILSQLRLGKNTLLELDRKIEERDYSHYRIDGVIYPAVIVYDLPKHIAIEAQGDFVGKAVECVIEGRVTGTVYETSLGKALCHNEQSEVFSKGEIILYNGRRHRIEAILPPSRPNVPWMLVVKEDGVQGEIQ